MMSSSSATKTTVNQQQIYRQAAGILNGNSLHFIPISLLFLPLIYSASLLLQLYPSFDHTYVVNVDDVTPTLFLIIKALSSLKTPIIVLGFAFALFVILTTIAGIVLITYSTYRYISGEPLTFSSAVELLPYSYIPLLSTVLAVSIKPALFSLLFLLFPIAITRSIEALGFHFDPFIFYTFMNTITPFVLASTALIFLVRWGSAVANAVLELKSGFEPTEFRSHLFSIVSPSVYVIGSFLTYLIIFNIKDSKTNWISNLEVGVMYLQSSLMILFHVVANTVLYVQYKLDGGEVMAVEAEGEVSGKYVSVSVDDENDEIPNRHESVTEGPHGGFSYMMTSLLFVWAGGALCTFLVNYIL